MTLTPPTAVDLLAELDRLALFEVSLASASRELGDPADGGDLAALSVRPRSLLEAVKAHA